MYLESEITFKVARDAIFTSTRTTEYPKNHFFLGLYIYIYMHLTIAQSQGGFQSEHVRKELRNTLKKLPIWWIFRAHATPSSATFYVSRIGSSQYSVKSAYLQRMGYGEARSFDDMWNIVLYHLDYYGESATLDSKTIKLKSHEQMSPRTIIASLKSENRTASPKLSGYR